MATEQNAPPAYEQPTVNDIGSLTELTAGDKNAPTADQLTGQPSPQPGFS